MIPLLFGWPWWATYIILPIVGLVLLMLFGKLIFGWIFIGESQNGIVVKKWGVGGSSRLPEDRIIATKREAGIQAQMLGPGLHFWYWPWMYSVSKQDLVTIPVGQIGIIEAIDGAKLDNGAILARKVVDCNNFQDAAAFITNGGQKGWQLNYLTPGSYRINQQIFKVTLEDAINIASDKIGLVTTLDGAPLPEGKIAGKSVTGHEHYQNAEAFLSGGGFRGLQEQVLFPGDWYINPMFAQVEEIKMTEVAVGYVGVVNSYIGDDGADTSGTDFRHGNIVSKGQKGIWKETLDPGLHPINTRLMKVVMVPTTNIVLNWADEKSEDHKLDDALETITVRSKDGFSFELEVSQVVNIPHDSASMVIARFGSIANMVAQVLEPTIGSYFRNSAQTSDALDFVNERQERQISAKAHIDAVLTKYNIVGVDTLIGDIEPPAELMKILTERKVAEQQQAMFKMQMASEEERQKYVKAKTAANKEEHLTAARYDKEIATQQADALVEKAKGDKASAVINAEGEVIVLTTVGDAKAKNIKAIGTAEADVIKLKTDAMGTQQFALVQIFEALAESKTPLVPQILVNGGGEGGGNASLLEALIGNEMLKELRNKKAEEPATTVTAAPAAPATDTPPGGGGGGTADDKKD